MEEQIEQGKHRKKQTLIMIKKRNLTLLLIVAMLIGGTFSGALLYATMLGPNYVSVKKDEYKQLTAMQQKYGKLEFLWQYIDQKYYIPVDDKALEEGMYKGLFAGLGDPYSSFLNEEEYKELMESTSGQYEGVGITMAPTKEGSIIVVAVTEGSPAAKAGIRPGDVILEIAGKPFHGDHVELAAATLRGKSGTSVLTTMVRDGKRKQYELKRATITTQSVVSQKLDGNLGYLGVNGFDEQTSDLFRTALTKMEQEKVKGLVIDLRGNPGGLVESGVEIADMLMDAGVVTYTVDRDGNKKYLKAQDGKTELPYVVLIDQGSASTAEILAAALKDCKGGTLVGTTTYGKGIIQSIEGMRSGEAVKLTVMQYFSPKGNEIHHKGVEPNITVALTQEDYSADGILIHDRQLEKAMDLLQK